MVREIKIDDFDYDLPQETIAAHPCEPRDTCKLLLSAPSGKIYHCNFKEIASLLPPSSMMVCNDTKVIKARLPFHKDSGARIEIFLLEPFSPPQYERIFQTKGRCVWKCLVGNLKKWKEGSLFLDLKNVGPQNKNVRLEAVKKEDTLSSDSRLIEFSWNPSDLPFSDICDAAGNIPIPPYLNRESEDADLTDYQTVYAHQEGSVAAPTAGLHFTQRIIEDLYSHNISLEKLTLHVGAGTFRPVKTDTIGEHNMHTETFIITESLIDKLIKAKKSGRKVVAVGTTSVRTLESLPLLGRDILKGKNKMHIDQWEAYEENDNFETIKALEVLKEYIAINCPAGMEASTAIMIAPGFKWRIADVLITNFHQPHSTLLLLVASFLGDGYTDKPQWRMIYQEALNNGYRFLSYGDACLLFPLSRPLLI